MVELTGQTLCARCKHSAGCAFGVRILERAVRQIASEQHRSGALFGADAIHIDCKLYSGRRDRREI